MPYAPPVVSLASIIGFVAGTLTSVAFLPQVIRAWRTRRTQDVSLAMLLVLGSGVAMWIVYGVLNAAAPVVAANVLTLLLVGAIVVAKAKFG